MVTESIDRSVVKKRIGFVGWADIGYSFLVGEDGNVYEGRGWNLAGAHCVGYNSKSIGKVDAMKSGGKDAIRSECFLYLGISVIGDYTSRKPNTAAINAVKALIQCGVSKGYISRNYILRGHRSVLLLLSLIFCLLSLCF